MGDKEKIPPIFIVFLVLLCLSIMSFLNGLVRITYYDKLSNMGTLFLNVWGFLGYSLVSIAILTLILIGLVKRKKYSRILSFIYYPLAFVFSLSNFLYYKLNPEVILNLTSSFYKIFDIQDMILRIVNVTLSISLIFSFLILTFVIILMIKKKDYFSK